MRIVLLKSMLPKPNRKKAKARRDRTRKREDILWHELVCERARVTIDGVDRFKCFHCERLFPREYVCGDHWPKTKGHNPRVRHDPYAGVCCCKECNVSGALYRKRP